ncbi:MAG: PhzF family phenazine biosynthesis protein [Leptolyngbyaceae cyanobacterium T60_A2020_046]|nr:PhzF family phenazine biosynthesis protein [Leptolyngbyaceae cyanobacterium T60_A2020_046]
MSDFDPRTILQVDAFSDRPFAGNPAAVCVLPQAADPAWMQAVAAEMNLSETAFLHPIEAGYHLRWFTPTAEVPLCGHATLASAHVLWSEGHLPPDQTAQFHTLSGVLTATLADGWITLNFPVQPVAAIAATPEILKILRGLQPVQVMQTVGAAEGNLLVELESEDYVRSLQPDFGLLKTLPAMGLIVTSRADNPDVDFVSRYFAPAVGIDEDPVTGSAHCSLVPYWQKQLGKGAFLAHQVSARGGVLKVEAAGDRVLIRGQAVTVMRGTLLSSSPKTI